jgi:hypothetical protein
MSGSDRHLHWVEPVPRRLVRQRVLPVVREFHSIAATRAERERTGDPRPSLEERYPTKEVYVAAVRNAAGSLVAKRLLLPRYA